MVPYFEAERFFWSGVADFENSGHFETSLELLRDWITAGVLTRLPSSDHVPYDTDPDAFDPGSGDTVFVPAVPFAVRGSGTYRGVNIMVLRDAVKSKYRRPERPESNVWSVNSVCDAAGNTGKYWNVIGYGHVLDDSNELALARSGVAMNQVLSWLEDDMQNQIDQTIQSLPDFYTLHVRCAARGIPSPSNSLVVVFSDCYRYMMVL